jgi:hypothetical protein
LYNAYFDVLDTGLIKRLPGLHERYGPVVSIQPGEVHVGTVEGVYAVLRHSFVSLSLGVEEEGGKWGEKGVRLI